MVDRGGMATTDERVRALAESMLAERGLILGADAIRAQVPKAVAVARTIVAALDEEMAASRKTEAV